MDITVTIGTPVLLLGETFNVSYALLPSGVPVDVGPQTNAPFTIIGLDPGDYHLIVAYVTSEGAECPDLIKPFTIPSDEIDKCECPLISSLYVQELCNGGGVIKVDFEDTGNAVCSYDVTYSNYNGVNLQTITYTSLPIHLEIPVPMIGINATSFLFGIKIKCCDGTEDICYPLTKIVDVRPKDCECDPPYITDAWINYDPVAEDFTLCYNISGSVPVTVSYSHMYGGTDGGTLTVSSIGYHEQAINPGSANPYGDLIVYGLSIFNDCGRSNTEATIRKCGEFIQYQGGETYPTIFSVLIPAVSGTQTINFNTYGVPDRLEVLLNGVSVLDTGYVGNIAYQPDLDAALLALGDPPATITPTTGMQTLAFTNTGEGIMTIKVYAPLNNTGWDFMALCE